MQAIFSKLFERDEQEDKEYKTFLKKYKYLKEIKENNPIYDDLIINGDKTNLRGAFKIKKASCNIWYDLNT